MKHALFTLTALALSLIGAGQARAGLVYYSSQDSFDAATSGLSTQTFAAAGANLGVGPGDGAAVNNPLGNSTNTGILPGLTITATTNLGGDIDLLGPDWMPGLVNYSVFANYGATGGGLNFAFGPAGVTAASLGVLSLASSVDVDISIYDTSSNLLGTFTLSDAPDTGVGEFFGVTSSTAIGSLTITTPLGSYPGADQVQWGDAIDASAVPEPATLTLLGFGAVGLLGYGWRRRKQQAANI